MTILERRPLAALAALVLVVTVAACHPKRPPVLTTTPAGGGASTPAETGTMPAQPVNEGPDVRPIEGGGATGSDIASAAAGSDLAAEDSPLADIHFDYDAAVLTEAAKSTLEQHVKWLQAHPDVQVTVEGHCDERGTVEYNLALGEQRARAARDYLVSRGVAGGRLRVVSYGKERPLDRAATEEAYAKNRRAHFAVSRLPGRPLL